MKNIVNFLPIFLFAVAGQEDILGSGAQDAAAESIADKALMSKKDAVKPVKVKFLKSPTGEFGLAYNAGDTGTVPAGIVNDLVEGGFCAKI